MAWSRIQSASSVGTGATPAVAYTTANLTAGTKLIAALALSNSNIGGLGLTMAQVATVADGSSNTMTLAGGIFDGGNVFLGLYAMDTPAGDVGTKPTITATLHASVNDFGSVLLVQEVSGLATGNTTAAMLDGTAATNSTTSTGPATTTAYSSGAASEYLVALYGDPGDGLSFSNPASGYSADANNVTGNGNAELGFNYKNSTGTSESASWTLGGTAQWATILVAFKLGSTLGPGAALPNLMTWRTEPVSRASGRMIRQ